MSVIVPAFNAAERLPALVNTLLRQTLPDIEIVLVDDGSTDATAEVARRLEQQYPRLRFFRLPENRGVAAARELAVRESRGEFLWFVDADDARADDALEKLVGAARATGADVVICSAEYVYDSERRRRLSAPAFPEPVSGRLAFRELLTGAVTGHLWNKLFRRDLALGIEFTPARVHSDLAMVAQLIASARTVTSIPDTLYSYLLRSGSIIRSGSRRTESLLLVESAVSRAAASLDPRILRSREYKYFVVRYVILSAFKDATVGGYDESERNGMIATLRSRLDWPLVFVPLGRRDGKRFALALTAKVSMPAHRRLLELAAERL